MNTYTREKKTFLGLIVFSSQIFAYISNATTNNITENEFFSLPFPLKTITTTKTKRRSFSKNLNLIIELKIVITNTVISL